MNLSTIVPWGRTLEEYSRFFALTPAEIAGSRFLDCGGGPASFTAEVVARGGNAIATDPIYEVSGADIRARFEEVAPTIIKQVDDDRDVWCWDFFGDPAGLLAFRRRALEGFLADFDAGRESGRYVAASLPSLPFPDDSFDVALSSHLLFLYSEHLSLDFHRAALKEMLRVAGEVRAFPLLSLHGGTSAHLQPMIDAFNAEGHTAELVPVNFEFRKGGREMLRLRR